MMGFCLMTGLEFVDVGSGQGNDQGPVWITLPELDYGLRAAPGVQGDHHIGSCAVPNTVEVHPMPKLPQQTRPAQGCRAIS